MVLLGLLWVPFIHLISSQLYIYLQSVQAYISPPIAVVLYLRNSVAATEWHRRDHVAADRLCDGRRPFRARDARSRAPRHYVQTGLLRWLVDMNFLHYAILMFVVCSLVLVVVSLMTPAPERSKLAGLTFATVDDKMDVSLVQTPMRKPAVETALERRVNIIFSAALVATVVGLWIYFR